MPRRLEVIISGDASSLARALGTAQTGVAGFAKSVEATGRSVAAAGRAMTHTITMPILAIGAASTKMALDFETSMELVHTQAGASQAEVDKMGDAIIGLVRNQKSYGQSANDMSKALYIIESSGMRGAKALNALRISAAGARVGNANLEATAGALTSAMKVYDIQIEDTVKTMATLNAIVGAGKMRMDDLNDALSTKMLPVARLAGITLEQAGAAVAVFTRMGVPAQAAATNLTTAFIKLQFTGKAGDKALRSLGTSSLELAKVMKQGGLPAALKELEDGFVKLAKSKGPEAAAQAIYAAFGGARGGAPVVALLQKLPEYLKILDDVMARSKAKTFWSDVASAMKQPEAQIRSAIQSLQASMIQIGVVIAPVVSKVANFFADLAKRFDDLSPKSKTLALELAGVAAAIGPVLSITGKLITLIGGLTAALTFLAVHPVVALVGALVALAGAGAAATYFPEQLESLFKRLGMSTETARKVILGLQAAFRVVQGTAQLVVDVVKGVVGAIDDLVSTGVKIKSWADKVNDATGGWAGRLLDPFGLVGKAIGFISDQVKDVAEGMDDGRSTLMKFSDASRTAARDLDQLTRALRDVKDADRDLAEINDQLILDRFRLIAAEKNLQKVYADPKSSPQQRAEALVGYRQELRNLQRDTDAQTAAQQRNNQTNAAYASELVKNLKQVEGARITAAKLDQQEGASAQERTIAVLGFIQTMKNQADAYYKTAAAMKDQDSAQTKARYNAANYAKLLASLTAEIGRVPTKKDIEVFLKTGTFQSDLAKLPPGVAAAAQQVLGAWGFEIDKMPEAGRKALAATLTAILGGTAPVVSAGGQAGKDTTSAFGGALAQMKPTALRHIRDAATTLWGEAAKAGHGGGNRLMLAVVEGMRAKKGDVTAGMAQMQVLAGSVRAGQGEAHGGGAGLGTATARGVSSKKGDVTAAMVALQSAAGGTQSAEALQAAEIAGEAIGAAIAAGIRAKQGDVTSAMTQMLLASTTAAGVQLSESPPFHFTAKMIGYPMVAGIVAGIQEKRKDVTRALAEMLTAAARQSAAREAASRVSYDFAHTVAVKVADYTGQLHTVLINVGRGAAQGVGKDWASGLFSDLIKNIKTTYGPILDKQAKEMAAANARSWVQGWINSVVAGQARMVAQAQKTGERAMSAFDEAVSTHKTPAMKLLDAMQMEDQIKSVTEALGPGVTALETTLVASIQKGLSPDQFKAASQPLIEAMNQQVADAQAKLTAAIATGDESAISQARSDLEAAQRAQREVIEFNLGLQAEMEKTAYEKREASLKGSFERQVKIIEKAYTDHKISFEEMNRRIFGPGGVVDKYTGADGEFSKRGTEGVGNFISGMMKKHPELVNEISGPGGINSILEGIGKGGGDAGGDLFGGLGGQGILNLVAGMIAQHSSLETEINGPGGINDIISQIKTQLHLSIETPDPAEVARRVQEINRAIEDPDSYAQSGPTQTGRSGSQDGGGAGVTAYQHGTPFVPDDMLAYLHKGEAVIPRSLNRVVTSPSHERSSSIVLHVHVGEKATFLGNDHRKVGETLAPYIVKAVERDVWRNRGVRK